LHPSPGIYDGLRVSMCLIEFEGGLPRGVTKIDGRESLFHRCLVGGHAYEPGIQVQRFTEQGPLLLYLLTKSFDSPFLSARDMGTVSCLSSMPETLMKIDLELYQRSTAASKDENSSSVLTWLSIHHTPSTPHGSRSSCYLKTQVNTISPKMEP